MPAELDPPELARLVDVAERPRAQGWSLRAALTRYAQPQPQRASEVIELLRRIEFALRPHAKALEQRGPDLWAVVDGDIDGGVDGDAEDVMIIGLLRALRELDRLADVLAAWAVDRSTERPDVELDAVVAGVADRLARLGVPREERERPASRRR